MSGLQIRRAQPGDLPSIMKLWEEASGWLGRAGYRQWQYGPDRRARIAGRIEGDIASGFVWVVLSRTAADAIVATITVDDRADPEFWSSTDRQDTALYAHRMIVARSAAGQRIGSALLDWAGRKACDVGKVWLRLDAWADNRELQTYYLSEGFDNLRTHRYSHRGSGALFQRLASVQTLSGPELVESEPAG